MAAGLPVPWWRRATFPERGALSTMKCKLRERYEIGGDIDIMNSKPEGAGARARACWFVGATYGNDDQTPRFLQEGIWENGHQDEYLDTVKSIQVGDRIAIKSSYTRKHDLPFDNRGQTVSVMAIKAIGTVKENLGDGHILNVDWKPSDPPREWYFYTNQSTVWRVLPGDWRKDALIGFTFEEQAQDINRFRNAPFKDSGTSAHPNATDPDAQDDEADATPEAEITAARIKQYSVDDILTDGCFIAREKLEKILECLQTKKNLILQGPPGTGKTWLAKRLAFALMGQRDDSKVRAVQFHPNLSYEDFIRGWRPVGNGKLTLVDGPFVEMMKAATKEPESRHVVVIEEINRGNPAQIFGEMLTLLEVDKRTPNEALELSYKRSDGERVFIPGNLYVIGTMNIADRSLALVDLALRRRFAFIDLEPTLGKPWRDWVHDRYGIDSEILVEIEKRLIALNSDISADPGLGHQFQVGHSYATPPFDIRISDAREWFRQVVDTEIGPLLDEYWFDALEKSKKARERLLEGF